MSRRPSGLLAALALLSACSTNPVSGRPEVVFMSTQREAQLGAEAAQQVAQQMGLVDDPKLVAYVEAIGARVAQYSPRQDVTYRFYVVDMEEPNAFALPGGYVYLSRGLIAFSNSEDELANVIGHEVGHVAARHAAQRQTRAVGVGVALLPAAILGAALGAVIGTPGDVASAVVNVPLQMLGVGYIAAYSRDQEREADEVGQEMAARAGYDPAGLKQFMDTLEAYEKLKNGETRRPGFFDSHPTTPERVAKTGERAAKLEWKPAEPIAPGRAAFLKRLDGLLVGANPAEGVFEGQRFLHPDLDFTVVFPKDWETVNSRAGVGAFSPEKDAQVVLEIQSEGSDPKAAADAEIQKLSEQLTVRIVESNSLSIHGHRAQRASLVVSQGRHAAPLEITWIAKGGLVYRFTAMAKTDSFEARRKALIGVSDGFRELTQKERAGIREQRLRTAKARSGESLAALCKRADDAWSEQETAVANAIDASATLRAGQLLKVAVPQRYAPKKSP